MTDEFAPTARAMLLASLLVLAPNAAAAQDDGHGPDAWQVTDVAEGDALNVRMGPGMQYRIIGSFGSNATGLKITTCVPLLSGRQSVKLSEAQLDHRKKLPRWCLVTDLTGQTRGWVAARYLTEDTSSTASAEAARSDDGLIDGAISLVARLYELHAASLRGEGSDPLDPALAGDFFTSDVVAELARSPLAADPLYGGQDYDVTGLQIIADPDKPMFRGMITVQAEFSNFGQAQTVVFRLRADTERPGAPIRIMCDLDDLHSRIL